MTAKTHAWYADRYVNKFGMKLLPLKPSSKLPKQQDWGDTETPPSYWEHHPLDNIGLNLGASGFCSLDIDCLESFAMILEEYGLPIESLDDFPTIKGASKGKRIVFRVPEGHALPYVKLNWPKQDDPKRQFTVFELRSAEAGGKARQDVLPPSIHPDTQEPYTWEVQPCDPWPTPPDWLIAIWGAWDSFKPQFKEVCPWVEPAERPERRMPPPRSTTGQDAQAVVDAYIAANPLTCALESYGYKRIGKRYLSPHSGTKLPGVILFNEGACCWIHHASDPLCSEESGQPVNSFDLYTYYEHNGDRSKSFKAAMKITGIELKRERPALSAVPSEDRVQAVGNPNYIEWRDQTDNGKPLATIENLEVLCNTYGIKARYNAIFKEVEISIPDSEYTTDNQRACSISEVISLASRHRMPVGTIPEYLLALADRNRYNPVANWIDSREWDGTDRLEALRDSLDPRNPALALILLKRWLISAVAAAFEPEGVAAHGVLVLQGAQNLGKTSWFWSLLGDHREWGKEGAILNPSDRDSVKMCISHWLVELGELDATFRKSDIAALKSFITTQCDELFLRYSRSASKFPRRTVFFASVNPKQYLHDETGNRRYWTIEAGDGLNAKHNLDVQQIWAQAKHLYETDGIWWLTKDEVSLLNEHNEAFETADPIEELIHKHFDMSVLIREPFTATEVLNIIGYDKPNNGQARKCGAILRDKFGVNPIKKNGKLIFELPKPKIQ